MGRPLLPDSLAIALAYRAHISLVLRQTTGAEETSEIRTKGMSALHCFAASRVGALHLCVVAAAHDEGDGAAEGRAHPRHLAANRRRGLAGAARFGRLRGASHRGAASRSRDSPREGEPRRGRTPASGSGTSLGSAVQAWGVCQGTARGRSARRRDRTVRSQSGKLLPDGRGARDPLVATGPWCTGVLVTRLCLL